MTASNESFSPPVQVPRIWTVPPIFPDAALLVPQAVTPRTTEAIAARIRVSLPIGLLPPFGRTAARRDHAEAQGTPRSESMTGAPALSMNSRLACVGIRKY